MLEIWNKAKKKNKIEMILRSKSQKINGAWKKEKKINAGNMKQRKKRDKR